MSAALALSLLALALLGLAGLLAWGLRRAERRVGMDGPPVRRPELGPGSIVALRPRVESADGQQVGGRNVRRG